MLHINNAPESFFLRFRGKKQAKTTVDTLGSLDRLIRMWNLDSLIHNENITRVRQTQFLLAIVIFSTLSLIPNPDKITMGTSDIALHFIGNVLLILSAWVACLGRYDAWMPLLFSIPYSILIELSQGLTEYRQPELLDVVANICGLATGFLICVLLEKKYRIYK